MVGQSLLWMSTLMKKSFFPNNKIVIASHNAGKVREIRDLIIPFGFEIASAADYGCEEPDETETTFEGNALLKARFVAEHCQCAALADDSGLVVPALGGEPGVYSARWAGENRDFNVAMAKVSERLTPDMDTRAYFVCALALVCPDGTELTFTGMCHGRLQFPPKGTFGFGYDPIFVMDGQMRTFGEMPYEEKKLYSHRTEAFKKFKTFLESC